MTDYFSGVDSKSCFKSKDSFTDDGSRPELLLEHFKFVRQKRLTPGKTDEINRMFAKWCELLFCGFNIAVTGPQSKFALLETFRMNYLDSCKIPNYRNAQAENGESFLNIHTIRIHGMQPISMAAFNHAMFDIKEERKVTSRDYEQFIVNAKRDHIHHVFMIHSFEFFLKECEDIFDLILRLYSMNDEHIHMILSSDLFNAGKKLNIIKFKARLVFFAAPYTESYFMEKAQLASELDIATDKGAVAVHKLFEERVQVKQLQDVYHALGQLRQIMVYIIEHFLQNCDQPSNSMEFHDLQRYCESELFIRRAAALRQHLGELEDHKIIENNETTNKIQCIVSPGVCRQFLEFVKSQLDK